MERQIVMEKYKESDKELLLMLLDLQEGTSPIRLSIGHTDESSMVYLGIVLHEAAPKVINTLVDCGYMCDLTENGMRVYKL